MPQPHRGQVHVDRPLTNISIAYRQDSAQFISDKVFPVVPVSKQSDQYFVYDIGDWYRTDTQRRAPGSESAGSGWNITTASYYCDVWAIHKDVDDQTRANVDSPLDLDRDSTEFIMQDMMIRKELEWTTAFFTTSLWTGSTTASDITPGNLWDTVAGTPIDDVQEQSQSIAEKTGFLPNCLILGPEVYKELREHPDVLDRIKYSQKGVVTTQLLAELFDVANVYVPFATRNTAAENVTDSMDFIYGKNALLCYCAPSPGVMRPSAGYTFTWSGLASNTMGQSVKRFRMEALQSDRIELESAFDQKLVASTLGVFFSAVVS